MMKQQTYLSGLEMMKCTEPTHLPDFGMMKVEQTCLLDLGMMKYRATYLSDSGMVQDRPNSVS
jgi:hypothetical protein